MGEAAVDVADDGIAEVHQAGGNAAFGHGVAGKGVEGNGQQRPGVHALEHALHNRDHIAVADKEDASHGGEAEGNADGHAEHHHDGKADQQPGDHTHARSSFPSSSWATMSRVLSSFGSVSVTTMCTTAATMQIMAATGKTE